MAKAQFHLLPIILRLISCDSKAKFILFIPFLPYTMRARILFCFLLFLKGCAAWAQIKLAENDDYCLQCVNSCNLKLCSRGWRTMKWTYEAPSSFNVAGGGQLRNDRYGWCATNSADPGAADYSILMEDCGGLDNSDTFAIIPSWLPECSDNSNAKITRACTRLASSRALKSVWAPVEKITMAWTDESLTIKRDWSTLLVADESQKQLQW